MFYDDHSWLAVSYKRANDIRRERDNFDRYVMGAYIYDIIQRCAPIFNPFAKVKCKPYVEKPYELKKVRSDSDGNMSKSKTAMGGGIKFMEAYAARHNAAMVNKAAMGDSNQSQLDNEPKRGDE